MTVRRNATIVAVLALGAGCSTGSPAHQEAHPLPEAPCGGLVNRTDALAGMGIAADSAYDYAQKSPSAAESGPLTDGYICVLQIRSAKDDGPPRTASLWITAQSATGGPDNDRYRALAARPGAAPEPLPNHLPGTSTRNQAWSALPCSSHRVVLAEIDPATRDGPTTQTRATLIKIIQTATTRTLTTCPPIHTKTTPPRT
ncbi:hypothetical protein [Embleya sp. AB8]|uniref:hypothetical protein n=1 Tax=Embleya sp. AB8 TaxID=3156304 RepID=UPI003C718B8C